MSNPTLPLGTDLGIYQTILDTSPDAIILTDLHGTILYCNDEAVRMYGYAQRSDMIGTASIECIAPEDRERAVRDARQLLTHNILKNIEYQFTKRSGCRFPAELSLSLVRDTHGKISGWVGIVRDISKRKESEEKLNFLAEASTLLASTLDHESILRSIAELLVPKFATWCTIDLREDDKLNRVAIVHADPSQRERAEQLKHYPFSSSPDSYLNRVLSSGVPVLRTTIGDELAAITAQDTDHLVLLRELGFSSLIIVPLVSRNRVIGALSLIHDSRRRPYTEADLSFAESLARRAATAIDNTWLHKHIIAQDKAKEQFLPMLAHELRNPLAPMVSAVELLRLRTDLDADSTLALTLIERQTKHLSRLIDDLLDISRITYGKIQLHCRTLDVRESIRHALETADPAIKLANHAVTLDLPKNPVFVSGDPYRIEQALINLLQNAAKYTPYGGTIRVSLGSDKTQATIGIRDNGVGIPADILPKIFDLFSQANSTLARSQGGLGIGLTLAKKLTELHRGTIGVQSAGPGKGSEFTISLPLCNRPAPPIIPPKALSSGAAQPPQTILLVDDNHDAAHAIGRLLTLLGHTVHIVHSGTEAVACIKTVRPTTVILDIGLPELDGYEVARLLRQDPSLAGARFIALTGYGRNEDKCKAQEAGFDRHFTKPVSIEDLCRAL